MFPWLLKDSSVAEGFLSQTSKMDFNFAASSDQDILDKLKLFNDEVLGNIKTQSIFSLYLNALSNR